MEGIGLRDADDPLALTRYLLRNHSFSSVAFDDAGKLAGVCMAGHDGRRGYLHHVAVIPEHRHRGIGRSLVERCLDALKLDGIEKVHLWVKVGNDDGITFWNRLGWSERSDIALMSIVTGDNPNA